jgi:hypothetical protein
MSPCTLHDVVNAMDEAIATILKLAEFGPPAATGRKFTVRRSDVHFPHENRYLAVFQTARKSGLRKPQ